MYFLLNQLRKTFLLQNTQFPILKPAYNFFAQYFDVFILKFSEIFLLCLLTKLGVFKNNCALRIKRNEKSWVGIFYPPEPFLILRLCKCRAYCKMNCVTVVRATVLWLSQVPCCNFILISSIMVVFPSPLMKGSLVFSFLSPLVFISSPFIYWDENFFFI